MVDHALATAFWALARCSNRDRAIDVLLSHIGALVAIRLLSDLSKQLQATTR